jgi:hypothetical protein
MQPEKTIIKPMEELQITQISSAEVVYNQDRAMIDTQIATAKAYPRDLTRAINNAIATVSLDEETAQTCHYSLPRSGKQISGPSVHLAKIMAQTWGNLRAEAKVIDIGKTQITSQAICFDLETNLAVKVEVKRSIMTRTGRMNDDMITVTGNAANAIALRNAIYAVIPKGAVDKVYRAAKDVMTGDISSEQKLIAKRSQVLELFKSAYKVSEDDVLRLLGKAAIDHIDRDDLVTLSGINQALKDGDASVESVFRGEAVAQKSNDEKEMERVRAFIENATDPNQLEASCEKYIKELAKSDKTHELVALYNTKLTAFNV